MATFERFPIAPTLPATDLQRAKRWYQDKLGLTPSTELPGGAGLMYSVGGNPMGFILYESEFAGTAENTAVAWAVENIDVVVGDLKSRGVKFEEYEAAAYRTEKGIASEESGAKAAWFKDSEGNILNLTQLPADVQISGRTIGQASSQMSGQMPSQTSSQTWGQTASGQIAGQQGRDTSSELWPEETSEETIEEREPVGSGTKTL